MNLKGRNTKENSIFTYALLKLNLSFVEVTEVKCHSQTKEKLKTLIDNTN